MTEVSEKSKRLAVCVPLTPTENDSIEVLRKTQNGIISRAEVMRQALFEMYESRSQQSQENQ